MAFPETLDCLIHVVDLSLQPDGEVCDDRVQHGHVVHIVQQVHVLLVPVVHNVQDSVVAVWKGGCEYTRRALKMQGRVTGVPFLSSKLEASQSQYPMSPSRGCPR